MTTTEAIEVMIAGGVPLEFALAAAKALENAGYFEAEQAPSARQMRNARYYQRRKDRLKTASVASNSDETVSTKTVSDVSSEIKTPVSPEVPPKDNNQTPLLPPSSEHPAPARAPVQRRRSTTDLPDAIRAELARVLDPQHVEAVFGYRVARKAAQTAYAAKLLAAELEKTGSPDEAADLMIVRNWQGFKLAWWENERARAPQQASAPPQGGAFANRFGTRNGKPSIQDAGRRLLEHLHNNPGSDLFDRGGHEAGHNDVRLISLGGS